MSSRRHFGTVRRRSSGRWQAIYWRDGKYISAGTFPSKADALAHLAKAEVSLAQGGWVDPRSGLVTLAEYATGWLEQRSDLAVRTRDLYTFTLSRHVLPILGSKSLSALTPSQIRSWHSQLSKVHPATAAKAYRLLSSIMRTAVTDELITSSPCRVKGAGVEHAVERPVATPAEVVALGEAMPEHLKLIVSLATWCQLRRGEILGLQRRDVDVANGVLHIRRSRTFTLDGREIVKAPKTTAGVRRLAVPPSVLKELERHLDRFCRPEPGAPVFTTRTGTELSRNSLEAAWKTARRQVGRPDLRLHDLRHTGLTFAAVAGATTAELMHRAGHASAAAALRYQHAVSERDRILADSLDSLATRTPSSSSVAGDA